MKEFVLYEISIYLNNHSVLNNLSKMKKIVLLLVAVILSHASLSAEEIRQMVIANSPSFETAAGPLRNAPAQEYEFSQAVLGDVLRLLAHDAGISFFSLPSDADGADKLVTFNITSSPFKALETLSAANGIALIYDAGIWYMRPANDKELIGRTYQVKYNSLETVSSNGGSGVGGGSGGRGGSGGVGSGLGANTGISLTGSNSTFTVEPSQLIEDIRELLDLATTGFSANLAETTSVDANGQISLSPAFTERGISGTSDEGESGPAAKVIWNTDSNTLFVVASRQQHMWIEGYLSSADTPQSLIALEVKFFETSKDPKEQFGLDWTGTLASGYNANLTGLSGPLNLRNDTAYRAPLTAVLSYEDVNVRLRALYDDQETAAVSYPRMITLNNREVVLRSVINQPVLASSSATSLGAGATTTSSVDYLPIGTVVNLLPKQMSDGKIQLNISLTISSIIGEEIIDGNPFPVATSRVYSAPVQLDSGFTVAIGGLDEARNTETNSGVPILGKIPVIKTAFAWSNREKTHKNLMIFITPTVVDGREGGLPDEPQAVVRAKPNEPPKPRIYSDGTLVASIDELPGAITALSRELDLLDQLTIEFRNDEETSAKIAELFTACQLTIKKIHLTMEQNPDSAATLRVYENELLEQNNRIVRLRRQVIKGNYNRKLPFNF